MVVFAVIVVWIAVLPQHQHTARCKSEVAFNSLATAVGLAAAGAGSASRLERWTVTVGVTVRVIVGVVVPQVVFVAAVYVMKGGSVVVTVAPAEGVVVTVLWEAGGVVDLI